jgi:DNA-binding transcriptional LysR family regulator
MTNISRIDLNLFVVFNAIYTERGITRASKALNLSQSAISHALSRLRDVTGDSLFIREGNTVTPTAVAHDLVGPIRRALAEFEGSLSQLKTFDPKFSKREFKIGIHRLIEMTAIPELMNEIRTTAPNVTISAVRHHRADFQMLLTTGALAAVVDTHLPLAHNIHHQYLGSGKLVVIARQGHPSINGRTSMETYLSQDHILASSRTDGIEPEDEELSRLGLQRRIKLRCQDYITACKTVSKSDMLLTIPDGFVRGVNEMFGNQVVPFPIEMPAQDIFLYWHASVQNDHANSWLRQQIIASFQQNSLYSTPGVFASDTDSIFHGAIGKDGSLRPATNFS